jgi:glycosyltransferase involved in cell wall biosynthesis
LFLVFAAVVPRLLGTRVILDIHDILPELYSGKFGAGEESRVFRTMLALERVSCRFAHHVIIANHLWYEKLIRRTLPAEKCTPIINYPDLSVFAPATGGRRGDGRFIVLYPGTLNHHQGVDIAIRAFALASARMPGAEFHVYGEGPARPELTRLIAELAVGDRVFLKERVPLKDVAALMAAADVGVVPKRGDGFGNEAFSTKILEFMACGVPVIVSRTQVDAYYFNPSVVRFFKSGDESELAQAMTWVYDHRTEHAEWIRNAREFAVRHSWQERVVDYRQIVNSLLHASSKAAAVAG